MSKIFYDHLIVLEEVNIQIDEVAKTSEEKEELWKLVDEIIHHRVMSAILERFPEKHKKILLRKSIIQGSGVQLFSIWKELLMKFFFDVETKNLFNDKGEFNPKDLGVSIVSLYKRTVDKNIREVEGEMFSFWEKDFGKIWPIFQNADRIIGFNSINFDVPALQPYADFPLSKLSHFDILLKVKEAFGKRISLDSIAK